MRASRSLASVGRWNPAAAGLAVFASATRVANRTWSTDLTIERGVIPCCSLYASCTSRRRLISRSEERRVGKECRSRWSAEQEKKNKYRDRDESRERSDAATRTSSD